MKMLARPWPPAIMRYRCVPIPTVPLIVTGLGSSSEGSCPDPHPKNNVRHQGW